MMREKNSIRRFLCLVLSLVMVASLFVACGKKDDTTGTTGTENTTTNTENTNTGDDTTDEGEEQTETAYFPRPETETLKIWTEWSGIVLDNPNEVRGVQEMEKATNVQVEWVYGPQGQANEQFGLMLASGDYPDIIGGTTYPGGVVAGYNDGVFADATELVDNFMPNYKAIVTSNPEWDKMTKTDDGMRIALYQAVCFDDTIVGEDPWIGTAIRQDWLDDLGLEVPETLDDWHTVLTAMKDAYGATMDINSGGTNYNNDFITAYGILAAFYQKDGKVYFGAMQDEYLSYLEMMQQWYAEGLINPNFTTYSEWVDPNTNFATDQASAGQIIGSYAHSFLKDSGMTQDEDFFLTTVTPAVMNEGDTPYTSMLFTPFTRYCTFSTTMEDPELAARYLDQYYTKEAMEWTSYGVEGESFVKDENGNYSFTDVVMNNPDGLSAGDALGTYALKTGSFFGYYNWGYASKLYGTWALEAQGEWKADSSLCLPGSLTMTTDETNKYYDKYTAIQTLVSEYTTQFIMGAKDASSFEQFQSDLVKYGIEECIAIQQAALDRYNAR